MSMRIRAIERRDRDGVEAALRSDGTFRPDEIAVALELVDDALADPASDYWFRIADPGDGTVAGYICYGPTPMTASTYDLYWIVTHAEARGAGVASGLIRAMEEDLRARAATAVRIETSKLDSYGAARRLYQRLGYPEACRLTDFYRAGDDLIVYYKRL